VPTLADLLRASGDRPKTFTVGYDVYDQQRVGFVSDGPDSKAAGRPFGTGRPGNGNSGHLYGTTLPEADKRMLLEFLKTL